MAESPAVPCPECSGLTKKIPSLCAVVVHGSASTKRRIIDSMQREKDMRSELSRDYGVEKVAPLGGKTMRDVYEDVKSRGDFVREEMKKSEETRKKKELAKRREWTEKANKRATKRRVEMGQRKAAEEASKRKIVL